MGTGALQNGVQYAQHFGSSDGRICRHPRIINLSDRVNGAEEFPEPKIATRRVGYETRFPQYERAALNPGIR
jgi:hypothetical protein